MMCERSCVFCIFFSSFHNGILFLSPIFFFFFSSFFGFLLGHERLIMYLRGIYIPYILYLDILSGIHRLDILVNRYDM